MPSAADFRDFALNTLAPLCRDRFFDPKLGGFHERLDAELRPLPAPRRLIVQCRQLYVLSHAAILGDASGAAAAEAGFAHLRRVYWDARHGGWFFTAHEDGTPDDTRKDFYAHAFVLFALAWLERAYQAPGAHELAEQTMGLLREHLTAPNGGYWEGGDAAWQADRRARRQNPHMHLLEAMHAWYETSRDAAWLDEASAIVALFRERMLDKATDTLGEHFAADWSAHPEHGHILEPGHHFEWAWLLCRHAELAGDTEARPLARRLFASAMSRGLDPKHGGIHDQVDCAGAPILRTRRIWPLTEAIKAAAILQDRAMTQAWISQMFRDFITPDRTRWIEWLEADGRPRVTELPGSTPYHIFLSAIEASRPKRVQPD